MQANLNIVESMRAAHFTMIRIQSEGVYQSDAFMDALDEAGIMVYHDLMGPPAPPESNHSARADYEVELRQAVRRLGRHPCVVLWNACNECGGGKGDATEYSLPIVVQEDRTRPVWPASPCHNGWKRGVSTLTGLPTGGNLTLGGPPVNESHG